MATSTLGEGSFLTGLKSLFNDAPEKFDMVLDKSHPSYIDLPVLCDFRRHVGGQSLLLGM